MYTALHMDRRHGRPRGAHSLGPALLLVWLVMAPAARARRLNGGRGGVEGGAASGASGGQGGAGGSSNATAVGGSSNATGVGGSSNATGAGAGGNGTSQAAAGGGPGQHVGSGAGGEAAAAAVGGAGAAAAAACACESLTSALGKVICLPCGPPGASGGDGDLVELSATASDVRAAALGAAFKAPAAGGATTWRAAFAVAAGGGGGGAALRVRLRNDCPKSVVEVAVRYQDPASKRWVVSGPWLLRPGQASPAVESCGAAAYAHARERAGAPAAARRVWGRQDGRWQVRVSPEPVVCPKPEPVACPEPEPQAIACPEIWPPPAASAVLGGLAANRDPKNPWTQLMLDDKPGSFMILRFKTGTPRTAIGASLALFGGAIVDVIDLPRGPLVLAKFEFKAFCERNGCAGGAGGADALAAAGMALNMSIIVNFDEPNWVITSYATLEAIKPNDPQFTSGKLWGLLGGEAAPFGANAAATWGKLPDGDGPEVVVGVIDSGVDVEHPDLQDNIAVVDGANGFNFLDNNTDVTPSSPADVHGTHVAGTIAAVGGNGLGVVGAFPRAKLLIAKVLSPAASEVQFGATRHNGNVWDAIKAIIYFTRLKLEGKANIVAINASWGVLGRYSAALSEVIDEAGQEGIVIVAAAGNGGMNLDKGLDSRGGMETPASYPQANIISVAAIDQEGEMSIFDKGSSNFGAESVDIGAPGSAIVSTGPGGKYIDLSGTSMAVPHVTAAVALYRAAIDPDATPAAVRAALLAAAEPTGSLAGKTASGGRLDLARLLEVGKKMAVEAKAEMEP
ncbi:MAG: peptidase S8/S53 domain-containing protein [Monoraphidium minutum]|nr:MAG: peptidase S8/S53 domain-containing protein [Monoraphidium minutum]